MSGTIRVEVPLGDRSYPVLVGAGARHELASVLRESRLTAGAQRAVVITQPGIASTSTLASVSRHSRFRRRAGQGAVHIGELCSRFTRFGLTRRDVVVGVGGGVVTDVAGFAAAVYHRGVAVAHVATTLLGQIDAAVGGKTGVNLAEARISSGPSGSRQQCCAIPRCSTRCRARIARRLRRTGQVPLHRLHTAGRAVHWFPPVARASPRRRRAAQLARRGRTGGGVRGHQGRGVVSTRPRAVAGRCSNYGHTLGHALEIAGAV